MREIKFRAWDDENKIWFSDRDNCYIESDGSIYRLIDNCYEPYMSRMENLILEQFTGLRDKNGREIYEGDIALTGDIIGIVVFKDGGFCFDTIDEFDCDYIFNFTIEIIGNIHENPELIK